MEAQTVNEEKEQIESNKRREEESWATVVRKLKSQHVIERLEKVESEMIVKKCEIRKGIKRTTEEETRKRIMIFNLKKKTGKSDVECVKDVFDTMGGRQSRDGLVGQREDGPNKRLLIVEFITEYDK